MLGLEILALFSGNRTQCVGHMGDWVFRDSEVSIGDCGRIGIGLLIRLVGAKFAF